MECKNGNLNKISIKITLATLLILLVCVTLFISFFVLTNNRINNIHENDNTEEKPVFNQTENSINHDSVYLIKEFNGKIAVYKDNDFQYQLEVYVITLPEKDKQLLQSGIVISGEQELNDILSSYY